MPYMILATINTGKNTDEDIIIINLNSNLMFRPMTPSQEVTFRNWMQRDIRLFFDQDSEAEGNLKSAIFFALSNGVKIDQVLNYSIKIGYRFTHEDLEAVKHFINVRDLQVNSHS